MKKLIKQDLQILLALIAAYHPEVAEAIEDESKKLILQSTREYLLLIRDGQCRISPYSAVFQEGSPDNLFWVEAPAQERSVWAMHLHLTRMSRDSPEGSIVMLDYYELRYAIQCGVSPEAEAHRTLTRATICSTPKYIQWLKGSDETWR